MVETVGTIETVKPATAEQPIKLGHLSPEELATMDSAKLVLELMDRVKQAEADYEAEQKEADRKSKENGDRKQIGHVINYLRKNGAFAIKDELKRREQEKSKEGSDKHDSTIKEVGSENSLDVSGNDNSQ